jgi:membrane-associated phospholipid phosphatase
MSRFQAWFASLLSTMFAVGVSVTWLDKPLAYFVHRTFGQFWVLGSFTGAPSFFSPLATIILLVFIARRILFRPFGNVDITLILCELSVISAKLIVPPLKSVFGRTWPLYNRPSLILDGAYGFNFFYSGQEFESFPSGHMASICALTVVFWICYPKFRPICAACISAMGAGLIVGNYHFLGDVIAGGFVGTSTAVLMVSAWETLGRWRGHQVEPALATSKGDERTLPP